MGQWKTVVGEVRHVGSVQVRGGQEDCFLLDSLVVRGSDGQTIRMLDIVVPGEIYEELKLGGTGQFEILALNYPKVFGSATRSFVISFKTADRLIDGIQNVKVWVRSSKGAALHYLWYGIVLMPAFGFGFLLWICAVRLLALNIPLDVTSSSQRG